MQQKTREVSEIVRRNVKQVIIQLQYNGMQYQQYLINQYINGQKSQYEFLLPKSKNHHYYLQQLSQNFPQHRQRKLGSNSQQSRIPSRSQQPNQDYHQNYPKDKKSPQPLHQKLLVVGTVQQVGVGAMCELIKQLRQNTEPYEPFENEVYEQELHLDFNDPRVEAKFDAIMNMVEAIRRPEMKKTRSEESPEKTVNVKTELVRSQLGTEKDGSMGKWGGKKYEGLGMRDEFTDYRKKVSKNFYQSIR